jgi:3'-phosphoadenosine 5'-phosphosulfate sulfotransferase (PAPS reductase)/FAD synthetase
VKQFISLGWGVQSFTIAAMVALGELPPVDAALHADTMHESEHTYTFAARWTEWLEERGVKVITVKPIQSDIVRPLPGGKVEIHPPFYTRHAGGVGQTRRQCTMRWKVMPLRRHIRPLLKRGETAEQWLGISTDEVQRAKDSDVQYIRHVFPLLDKRMSRADCVQWMEAHKLEVPPKSACSFCPFHNKRHWQEMKREGGNDWATALAVDSMVRYAQPGKANHELFVHANGKPLAEAVVIPEDFGMEQATFDLDDAACDSGHCFM